MKKLFLAGMLAFSSAAFAQITLDYSGTYSPFSQNSFKKIRLDGGVDKLYALSGSTIQLYNPDYTLYKSFSVASVAPSGAQINITYVSNTLFDTDPSDIEYMITWYGNTSAGGMGTFILDETGATLLSVPNFVTVTGVDYESIFEFGNKTILRLFELSANPSGEVRLYDLPGKISKDCCCDDKGKKNKHGHDPMGPSGSGNLAPNPVQPGIQVNYTLPEGAAQGELRIIDTNGSLIRTVNVGNQFNQVILDPASLNSGTYYYQLFVDGKPRDGQVIMVVK